MESLPAVLKLTNKQEAAAQHYALHNNQLKAYEAGGYSMNMNDDRLRKKASDLFKSSGKVWARVMEIRNAAAKDVQVELGEVLQELKRLAFVDIRQFFDDKGVLLPISDLPTEAARALASVDNEEIFEGSGKDRTYIGDVRKIKVYDKTKALDMLMKYLGAYKEEEKGQTNIQFNIYHAQPAPKAVNEA